ncbi:MAG: hypothetical protein JWM51_494 [Microbacteriaceae bacterium]|jgi:hypothetical protein|nr:hypothetical protein [Microbacteriaceae bacterium]
MTDLKLPGDKDKSKPSPVRVAIWICVAGVGIYMLLSGVIGALNAG